MSEQNHTEVKTIAKFTRQKSSVNGNPRYLITFTDGTSAFTPVDGSVGYKVADYYIGRPVNAEFNKRGQVLDFEEIK